MKTLAILAMTALRAPARPADADSIESLDARRL